MKETFYKTRTRVTALAKQRVSVIEVKEGKAKLRMKRGFLKDKKENARNEI